MKRIALFILFLCAIGISGVLAQTKTITGVATSASDGMTLPGVSVSVKGTTLGTVTDIDGKYSLKVPDDATTIVFSFIGMKTKEVEITSTVIDVAMESGDIALDEIVVTSMGISREKKSLGYAVQEVGSDDIASSASKNMIDAINSKIAGVQIQNSGGQAGSGTGMVIRGFSSINYSNQPLYVVDGVPINNDVVSHSSAGTPSANRAVDLDPEQIESMSVLKGGAATALYGIRAANGAVIITTKKGSQKQGLKIDYNFSYSLDKPNHLHEWNSDYARGRYGQYSNLTHWSWGAHYDTNPLFPTGTVLDLDGDGTTEDVGGQAIPQYKDNYSRFWQDGNSKTHSLSASGGSETGTFFVSVSRLDQEGITPNQDYDKTSFVVNVSQKIKEKITVYAKANYINTGGTRFRTASGILDGLSYWHNMWDVNSYPWKNPATGDKTWFSGGVPHPQWVVNEEGEDWRLNRLIGNIGFDYKIAPWLTMKYTAGVDTYAESREEIRPFGSVETASRLGDMTVMKINQADYNQDLIFNGKVNFGEDFDLSYLVGGNIWQTKYDRLLAEGTEFVLKDFYNLNNTVEVQSSTYKSGKILYGVYSDFTLGWKNAIYLGVTARNDWSSTLPVDNNSFFYPSVNLGVLVSELTDIPGINYLKVRGSYSQMANDAPTMALSDSFSKDDPNIYGNPRFTISNSQNNPALKPERTNEIELGIEARGLNDILGLDLALYNRTSLDQIIRQPVSSTTGYSTKLINLGEVSNKGIEATLSIMNPFKGKDFKWNTYLNFTKNDGKVVRLGQSTDDDLDRVILTDGWWTSALIVAVEGEALGTIYGDPWQRYGQDLDPSDPDYVSPEDDDYLDAPLLLDAEGKPTLGSQTTKLGNVNPDWTLGITSEFEYKAFTAGFTLERRQGGDMVNGMEAAMIYSGLSTMTQDRWYDGDAADGSDGYSNTTRLIEGRHADGSINTTPAKMDNDYWTGRFRSVEEELVQDGSWWRLRTVYLGYRLPNKLLKDTFIKGLKFTFTGKNLFLSTPYKGNDPELSFHGVGNYQGFDELVIPNNKSYMFSISATF